MSAILALETGQVFHGTSIGVSGVCVGEVVFNTAMTGYQEVLTDPSYNQQIITFTYPHIGNTGINQQDSQSKKIYAAGVVLRSLSTYVSNWRATCSLADFLQQQSIVAIAEVDTRGLTKIIRESGALNACIMTGVTNKDEAIQRALAFKGLSGADLTAAVTTDQVFTINKQELPHIVLYDFGVKDNIVQCIANLGCKVTIVPAEYSAQQILALKPAAVILSNGPGDPQACTNIIENIKQLLVAGLPLFGICLGHQLLALAMGAKTYKMPFGHHGSNHPVQHIFNKKIYITSQNHGFAIEESSLPNNMQITHRSLFDNTIQGFKHTQLPIYGFQGHPEAAPGPHDAQNMFSEFIAAIREHHA